jgi:ABC-type uncharacterized transport system substrate-binding protein
MYATFQFTEREYIKWVEKMNESCKTKVIIRYNPNNYLKEKKEAKKIFENSLWTLN